MSGSPGRGKKESQPIWKRVERKNFEHPGLGKKDEQPLDSQQIE
jgi:hypothetical protein